MFLQNVIIFAYFSPETFLPLTSVIASAVGVFLLFGSTVLRIARRALRRVVTLRRPAGTVPKPHFRPQEASTEWREGVERHNPEESDQTEARPSGRRLG
jgi:hypothetical protein